MQAVDEIDVEHARRSEHHLRARGPATGRVTGQVMLPQIGLGLGDHVRRSRARMLAHQRFADKITCHGIGIAVEEIRAQNRR